MGRFIANYEFLVALLNHSHYDSFHLFCMNPQHLQTTAQRLTDDANINSAAKSKIQLFLYSSLGEKLESQDYHVFHLGGWGYFFAGLVQLRNYYARSVFPITGVIHSLNARDARYDYYKLLKAPLLSCDAVVCTSSAGQTVMAKQLARVAELEGTNPYQGQLPIIPLGVAEQTLPDRPASRQLLGLNEDSVALLYLGRLSPNTKADLYPLLLSFKQLQATCSQPITLFLAGGASPHELSLHEDMVRELGLRVSVHILSNIEPATKWRLYAAADIAVAPADNLQETFGISIIEAMQAGLPVVASDLNGYRDLVENGKTGFLIRTTWIDTLELAQFDEIMDSSSLQTLLAQTMVVDLDQFQARLVELIEHSSLREQMGQAAQRRVADTYFWPRVIDRYQAVWDELKIQAEAYPTGAKPDEPYTGYFSNAYLEGFSHYPSQVFNTEQRFIITELGKSCLQSGQTPPIYSDVAMLLDQEWLRGVMTQLINEPQGITAGQILADHGDQGNRGRFSLLWAAKYGLLGLS